MAVVINPNEPGSVKNLFEDRIELPMGFDMMLYTNSGRIPIERKENPGDLLASVTDGRLKHEIAGMGEISPIRIVLLHGKVVYDSEGRPIVGWTYVSKGRKIPRVLNGWNRTGIRNLRRTLQYVEGVFIEEAESDEELVQIISELQMYFDKDKHLSLKTRTKLHSTWPIAARPEMVMGFYQGIPGVSAVRAMTLYEQCPNPLDLYQCSVEEMVTLHGVGSVIATHIYNFLRQGCSKECKLCY